MFTEPEPLIGLLKVNDQFDRVNLQGGVVGDRAEAKLGSSDNTSVPPLIVVGPV